MSEVKARLKQVSEGILNQILTSEGFQKMEGIPAPIRLLVPSMTRLFPDYLSKAIDSLDDDVLLQKIKYINEEVIPWLLSEPTSESQS